MSRQDDPPPDFSVNPQTPTRNVRHKSSLEHVFHFTLASPQPSREQANEADFLYHEILNDCESAGLFLPTPTTDKGVAKVYLHDLFRALHKFCPTDLGRVNLVRMILHGLFSPTSITSDDRLLDTILSLARKWSDATDFERQQTYRTLELIAADFLAGFFIPLTAQSNCTPSVSKVLTPPSASSVGPAQGTPFRLGGLRQLCLLRDGNRCLVSGHLDKQFYQQSRSRGQQARGIYTVVTQAAHIIPHSLNSVKSIGDSLSTTKSFVWQILNMFQTGTSTELEGSLIDTPANALMLASEIHDEFGKLRCYFEEVEDTPHTYVFKTTRDAAPLLPGFYPLNGRITFVNHEPEGQPLSDLPCGRLLKLHAACCKMMEMAGAAEYVDQVLDDLDRMEKEGTLAASGSSDIGMLLRMKGLGGWAGGYDETLDTRYTFAAGG
ncbi:hypothetical protein Q9L58_006564 [Maublancomyces gigas]|uniref:HNH nuclease domain-containing protein n=1 Tax=Discina gigas TaxID=1032678 RepID=A0ABR3GEX6_9PEZI